MVMSACAGTLNGLMLASALIRSGQAKNVLVSASSTYSSFNRPELIDSNWMHSVIFGDAAAAVVVSASDDRERGFSNFYMGADNHNDIGVKKFGGSKRPFGRTSVEEALLDFHDLDLRKVPDNLNNKFTCIYEKVLEQHGVRPEQLDWVLFNMSNAPGPAPLAADHGHPRVAVVLQHRALRQLHRRLARPRARRLHALRPPAAGRPRHRDVDRLGPAMRRRALPVLRRRRRRCAELHSTLWLRAPHDARMQRATSVAAQYRYTAPAPMAETSS